MTRLLLLTWTVLCLRPAELPAQAAPFLQTIRPDDSLAHSSPHRLRRTADGGLLQVYNAAQALGAFDFTGFARFDAAGQIVDIRGIEGGHGFEHRLIDMLELPDGRKVCLAQIDLDPVPASVVTVAYALKMLGPGLDEIWSIGLGGSWFPASDYPRLLTDAQGNIYGALRRGMSSTGELTHMIFKIRPNGTPGWAKELKRFPYALALDPGGDLIVSLGPSYTSPACILARFDPMGTLVTSRYVKDVSIRDVEPLPDGLFLMSGHSTYPPYDKFLLKTDNYFQTKGSWKLGNVSDLQESRNLLVINQNLFYLFMDPPGGERGRIVMRLDGAMQIEKAVYLPKENGPTVDAVRWGPLGLALSTSFLEAGKGVALLALDSTLNLPGCSANRFCPTIRQFGIQTLPIELELEEAAVGPFPRPLKWVPRGLTLQQACLPPYIPPSAEFSLPDSVCQNQPVTPGGLQQVLAGEWIWTIDHSAVPVSLKQEPVLTFTQTGPVTVTQVIRYQGCRSDTFSRTVLVLPTPAVDLGPDTLACDAAAVVLEVEAGPGVVFAWDDQSAEASRVVTESGQYVVLASDAHCPGSDTVGVTFVDTHAGFFAPDSICLGETFDLFPDNQHFQARHSWSFDPPALAATPQVDPEGLTFAEPGVYRILHSVETMGCIGQAYRDITVLPLPEIGLPADTFLCRDSLLAIQPVIPAGATFSWKDGHPELDRLLDVTGTFQLTVVEGRCAAAARLVVRPGDCLTPIVFAPNIFSPNGDGLHDLFEVWVRNAASVESLSIYDRWGSLLHQSSGDISWDGRAAGRTAEPGTYVYILKIKRKDGLYATAGGGVTLIR